MLFIEYLLIIMVDDDDHFSYLQILIVLSDDPVISVFPLQIIVLIDSEWHWILPKI